jgi:hypothetical protein
MDDLMNFFFFFVGFVLTSFLIIAFDVARANNRRKARLAKAILKTRVAPPEHFENLRLAIACADHVTDWFPPDVKPVLVGLYEVAYVVPESRPRMARWDGNQWLFAASRVHGAGRPRLVQDLYWRGQTAIRPAGVAA